MKTWMLFPLILILVSGVVTKHNQDVLGSIAGAPARLFVCDDMENDEEGTADELIDSTKDVPKGRESILEHSLAQMICEKMGSGEAPCHWDEVADHIGTLFEEEILFMTDEAIEQLQKDFAAAGLKIAEVQAHLYKMPSVRGPAMYFRVDHSSKESNDQPGLVIVTSGQPYIQWI